MRYIELIEEKRLVELSIEDEEKKLSLAKTKQQRELSERRLLDYEQHLKSLMRKLEFDEVG